MEARHERGAEADEDRAHDFQHGLPFFAGSSAGVAAMAPLGIGVGLDVSVAGCAALGVLGNSAKTGVVPAGVIMGMVGAGVSVAMGPSFTRTYERATNSPAPAGPTAQCVPQLVIATPLGAVQLSGQNLDDAVTCSFGVAFAVGVFSGVSCGVALNAE